jgi:hypothetical protein
VTLANDFGKKSSFPRKRESMLRVIRNDEKAQHQNGFPLARE